MGLARAYLWKQERVAVESSSRTVVGFWVCNDWWRCHDLPVTPGVIGEAVEAALDASTEGVPAPGRDGLPVQGVWQGVGVRSWAGFVRHAASVGVEREGDRVTVTPKQNRGAQRGYAHLTDKAVILVAPTAAELGQAVLDAFELCE